MKEIIVISVMTGRRKTGETVFHFKGVYAGKDVKEILVSNGSDFKLVKNNEYLLHMGVISYSKEKKSIHGLILRAKNLASLTDYL